MWKREIIIAFRNRERKEKFNSITREYFEKIFPSETEKIVNYPIVSLLKDGLLLLVLLKFGLKFDR